MTTSEPPSAVCMLGWEDGRVGNALREQHSAEVIGQCEDNERQGLCGRRPQGSPERCTAEGCCARRWQGGLGIYPLPGELDEGVTREEMDGAPVDKDPVARRDELPWTEVELARITVVGTPVVIDCPVLRLVTGEVRMAVTPTVEEKRLDVGFWVVRVVDCEVVEWEERVGDMGVLGVVLGKEGRMLVLGRETGVPGRGGLVGKLEGEKLWVGREEAEDKVEVEVPGKETKEEMEAVLDVLGKPREVRV